MKDAETRGMSDRVSAPIGVELIEQTSDVEFGRMGGNAKPPGYSLVRRAFGQQAQHFQLALRQSRIPFELAFRRPCLPNDKIGGFADSRDTQAPRLAQQGGDPFGERGVADLK